LQDYNIAIITTKSKQNTIVILDILEDFFNINKQINFSNYIREENINIIILDFVI